MVHQRKPRPTESDDGLCQYLESTFEGVGGQPAKILSIDRERNRFATTYPADSLTVKLSSGQIVWIHVKYLGSEQNCHPLNHSEREALVYKHLLHGDNLPIPRYYGSYPDRRNGTIGLYLEHLDAWSLQYHALEHWYTAARRLAELHTHFAADPEKLMGCDYLHKLSSDYFEEWSERAVTYLATTSPELAKRLESSIKNYDAVTKVIAAQPVTLVHNALLPKNIMADTSDSPARICIVDWEMAGAGCAVLDLVRLKDGLGPVEDDRICEAYRDGCLGSSLIPSDPKEWDQLLAACEIHRTIYYIARNRVRKRPVKSLQRKVAEVERLIGLLES